MAHFAKQNRSNLQLNEAKFLRAISENNSSKYKAMRGATRLSVRRWPRDSVYKVAEKQDSEDGTSC